MKNRISGHFKAASSKSLKKAPPAYQIPTPEGLDLTMVPPKIHCFGYGRSLQSLRMAAANYGGSFAAADLTTTSLLQRVLTQPPPGPIEALVYENEILGRYDDDNLCDWTLGVLDVETSDAGRIRLAALCFDDYDGDGDNGFVSVDRVPLYATVTDVWEMYLERYPQYADQIAEMMLI